jgi:S-adenosylmethionine uptake transporter
MSSKRINLNITAFLSSRMQSLWMLFAGFAFSIMGVGVKLASRLYSTSEIVMYRSMIGTLFIVTLVAIRGGTLKTAFPWHHLWRGTIGVTAFWLWFYSFSVLPLATSVTLNYTAPIWIAAIVFTVGWWQRKTRFELGLIAAICLSFVGVALLLRPTIQSEQWFGGIIALLSGILSAFAYMQVRKLGQLGEPEYRVVFYFSITGVLAGLLGTIATSNHDGISLLARPHNGKGIALLLMTGVCATLGQIAMTRAYRLGKLLVTANLQYTGIVFSSFWGILIWSDVLNWLSWLGIAVILASGIIATFYNARTAKPATEETVETDPIATEV